MIATDDIQELFCLNGIGATCPKITFPNFGLLFSQLLQTDVSQFQKTKKKKVKKNIWLDEPKFYSINKVCG